MSKSNFLKTNNVTVTLSDKDKTKLNQLANADQKSLAEWLRDQITIQYFVNYEQTAVESAT